jgi:AcrR family transcriptional regulator
MPTSPTTSAAGTVTRRDRKREEARDSLYRAAVELYVERGFEATTMHDIAERADVARATVFNHFPQKVAFLEEWGRRRREQVATVLAAAHAEDLPAAAQLGRYLQEMARLNTDSRIESVVLMDASVRFGGLLRNPALDVELTAVVHRGQERGELRRDVDPGQVGALLAAGYFAAVLRWIATDPAPFELADELARLLDIVLRGLLPG